MRSRSPIAGSTKEKLAVRGEKLEMLDPMEWLARLFVLGSRALMTGYSTSTAFANNAAYSGALARMRGPTDHAVRGKSWAGIVADKQHLRAAPIGARKHGSATHRACRFQSLPDCGPRYGSCACSIPVATGFPPITWLSCTSSCCKPTHLLTAVADRLANRDPGGRTIHPIAPSRPL